MGKNYSEDISGINWKHFYKQVLVLIIPMALQNLINVGVTAADVLCLDWWEKQLFPVRH